VLLGLVAVVEVGVGLGLGVGLEVEDELAIEVEEKLQEYVSLPQEGILEHCQLLSELSTIEVSVSVIATDK
jgi:hypothetical protein